jgi:regulator of replication initiation timing
MAYWIKITEDLRNEVAELRKEKNALALENITLRQQVNAQELEIESLRRKVTALEGKK